MEAVVLSSASIATGSAAGRVGAHVNKRAVLNAATPNT